MSEDFENNLWLILRLGKLVAGMILRLSVLVRFLGVY